MYYVFTQIWGMEMIHLLGGIYYGEKAPYCLSWELTKTFHFNDVKAFLALHNVRAFNIS